MRFRVCRGVGAQADLSDLGHARTQPAGHTHTHPPQPQCQKIGAHRCPHKAGVIPPAIAYSHKRRCASAAQGRYRCLRHEAPSSPCGCRARHRASGLFGRIAQGVPRDGAHDPRHQRAVVVHQPKSQAHAKCPDLSIPALAILCAPLLAGAAGAEHYCGCDSRWRPRQRVMFAPMSAAGF